MRLSSDREAELIEQNISKIYRAVDNFKARGSRCGVQLSYDDCVQEVTIAFLKYIRRCESEKQLDTFPWYDALHALSELVLRSQPLAVPIKTTNFNAVIHSLPQTVSYDVLLSTGMDIDGMSKHWVSDEETKIDFDAFMSEQAEDIQRIASMRLYGMKYDDIAGQFGVSKASVANKIKKLRCCYDNFIEGEDNNE